MSLSVVIPTFNQRGVLADCLDALGTRATDVEVIVVNGPSTDGTSGRVLDRSDVDVLVELSTRNVNVARNVGISRARRQSVAILDPRHRVTGAWSETIRQHLEAGDDAISGPVIGEDESVLPDQTGEGRFSTETLTAGNLATTRDVLFALDGFDEYLDVGGVLDFASRLPEHGFRVVWHPSMAVERIGPRSDRQAGGHDVDRAWFEAETTDWGRVYRSMAYRLVKTHGYGPRELGYVCTAALRDGLRNAHGVLTGSTDASRWYVNGWSVVRNAAGGIYDGIAARRADRTSARNPHGLSNSTGADVIVDDYDWR